MRFWSDFPKPCIGFICRAAGVYKKPDSFQGKLKRNLCSRSVPNALQPLMGTLGSEHKTGPSGTLKPCVRHYMPLVTSEPHCPTTALPDIHRDGHQWLETRQEGHARRAQHTHMVLPQTWHPRGRTQTSPVFSRTSKTLEFLQWQIQVGLKGLITPGSCYGLTSYIFPKNKNFTSNIMRCPMFHLLFNHLSYQKSNLLDGLSFLLQFDLREKKD